jgi:D-amino-acid dehydrogenase
VKVTIVGAGLAGLCAAHYLHGAGATVTILERGDGPGLETSYANGALLHPSLADPWNAPGVLGFVLRNLGREDSPMLLRPAALPSMLRWGLEFVRQSRPDRFERNAVSNLLLARYSLERMHELRESLRLEYGAYRRGAMALFRDRRTYDAALAWAGKMSRHGLEYSPLDVAATLAREPALAPIGPQLCGAIYYATDEGGDAYRFCGALARSLAERGATFRYRTRVQGFVVEAGRVRAVRCLHRDTRADGGADTIDCDAVVLAAGSHSTELARPLGLSLPVRPVKGYSITVTPPSGALVPLVPLTDSDLHVAVVPLADGRMRVAGTAEFAGYDTTLQPARIANLVGLLRRLYPDVMRDADVVPWTGLRPMCADGVPLIGATRVPNLFLNTGHGHLGWTLAAGSGRLAADAVLGRAAEIDASRYALARF